MHSRYEDLRRIVLTKAVGEADLARFEQIERSTQGTSRTAWEAWVATSGAAQHREVTDAARRLWEALGPNEYARSVKGRPRTSKGFAEGRLWLIGAIVPTILLTASGVAASGGPARLTLVAAGLLWPAAVARAFACLRRRRDRIGGAELPHL